MATGVVNRQPAVMLNFPNYDSEAPHDLAHFISRLFRPESIKKKEYLRVKVLKFHFNVDNMSSRGILHLLRGKSDLPRFSSLY